IIRTSSRPTACPSRCSSTPNSAPRPSAKPMNCCANSAAWVDAATLAPMPRLTPWIAPSILSADFARLGAEVESVLAAGADVVHFDVMDNHYVPNLTIGPLVCEALRKHGVTAPIDVHLMVRPVDRIIPDFAKAGASIISFHPEASEHVDRTIGLIHESGCQAGLVFNPATPLNWLDHTLANIDLVLIMSVNPGFGGQKFIPGALAKLAE